MDFMSLEELKQKLKDISEKGFIKSHRSNNTGIGKTLEDEMGISENNLPEHDFTIGKTLVELKAQRIEAVGFRYEHKKQNISFFDAVGYIFSIKNGFYFVTGDKEFENMKNVEFIKK